MILPLYRMVTSVLYGAVYPYARYKERQGDSFWRGRLGKFGQSARNGVWIHAASAGETRVASYLAHFLRARRADLPLVGSVQTRTGFDLAPQVYPDGMTVGAFPFDSPQAVRHALNEVQPRVIVITETEIWFEFLGEAIRQKIPIVLVNGRLSDKAFRRYRRINVTMRRLLEGYNHLFCKSETDAERYRALGAPENRITVTGDMKFDAPLPPRSQGRIAEIRARIGANESDFVLVAGSTRPGEEQALLTSLKNSLETLPRLKFVIAPRHIERCGEVREMITARGLNCDRYGQLQPTANCILVEEFGVLEDIYQAADLAFVGGTLVEIGGHNVLEPVWNGTPALFGPSTSNILEAADYIVSHNFGQTVNSADEVVRITQDMIEGKVKFAIKTDNHAADSPTDLAGKHILEILNEA